LIAYIVTGHERALARHACMTIVDKGRQRRVEPMQ
jgi:hypothetical protein